MQYLQILIQFNTGFCKAQMQNGILGFVGPSTILYYALQYYSVFIYLFNNAVSVTEVVLTLNKLNVVIK
jgi:hypothetical protein